MKTINKYMLAAFLCIFGLQAVAQGIVINKTDGTKIYLDDAEVESIGVFGYGEKPEPQPGDEEDEEVKTFTLTGNGKTATFKMKLVKAGTFSMGTSAGDDEEKPVHDVTISKNYYMGETEVTQQLWYAVMGQTPTSSNNWNQDRGMGDKFPAYSVSWNDCQTFITKLNEQTGAKFRLPTEAEWEYAARGGHMQTTPNYTYAGSNNFDDVAWCYQNSSFTTHPVGQKKANELGLYDMTGNLWEWCNDWAGSYPEVTYPDIPTVDPIGPASGSARVHRGAGWYTGAVNCRVTIRGWGAPTNAYDYVGFRLAL